MAEHSRQKEKTRTKASGGKTAHKTKLGRERSRKPAPVAGLEGTGRVALGERGAGYGEISVFNLPLWEIVGGFGLC